VFRWCRRPAPRAAGADRGAVGPYEELNQALPPELQLTHQTPAAPTCLTR
jgi:hypothetical protein